MIMGSDNIILVEDDVNLRHTIALILQRAGYLVTVTDNLSAAMDLIRPKGYKLIIADNNMPETRKILRSKTFAKYPSLSILIMCEHPHSEVNGSDQFASTHYVVKPVAPQHLLEQVALILNETTSSNHM